MLIRVGVEVSPAQIWREASPLCPSDGSRASELTMKPGPNLHDGPLSKTPFLLVAEPAIRPGSRGKCGRLIDSLVLSPILAIGHKGTTRSLEGLTRSLTGSGNRISLMVSSVPTDRLHRFVEMASRS